MTQTVLYETVADSISVMISAGTLRPGERVPSVRRLSVQRRVSVATVLRAYEVLENRGLIEARPNAGYYVRHRTRIADEPSISNPPKAAKLVGISALVQDVLDSRRPGIMSFGTACPPPEYMPTGKLQRLISSISRRKPLAVAKPGDTVALESPTYFGLLQTLESLGIKALEIPTHPREGISLDALEFALDRSKIAAVIAMPNAQNPLGFTMSDENKKRLVKMLDKRSVPLIATRSNCSGRRCATTSHSARARCSPRPTATGIACASAAPNSGPRRSSRRSRASASWRVNSASNCAHHPRLLPGQ